VKITSIELERLRLPLSPPFHAAWDPDPREHFDATLVRVHTDEGVTGLASGDTMDGFEAFEHLFVGRNPLALTLHARTLETISFHAGRYWPVEAALWDLAGRVLGAPVATLLGGAADRVPVYASLGELRGPDQRADDARALVQQGFKAVKVRIARDRMSEGISVVTAMRDAVGDALGIMVDLNQWWRMPGDIAPGTGPQAARPVIDALAEQAVLWVEEPLAGDDLEGMRMLRQATGVRIAGGEMARSFDELRRALEHDALDVVQPDVVLALGISGARTLADLALRRNRWFTPHTWTNGIGLLANLHVCCGVGGGPYLEYPYDPPGWTAERRDFMLAAPLEIEADGYLAVAEAPGFGIELDEDAVAHYALGATA
jgi:L-alanine-DL-glutamate epimerase-like enolase superfamily enzyme